MKINHSRNILISIVLLTSIIVTTIVYSAFSTQLQINGEGIVRSDNDIRITNVKVLNQTNNAYETYNNKYTKETTSMFVTLPSNSSITYEVEITDKANTGYIVQSISEISNTNSNIDIDIGLNQYDLISANSTKKFNINFTNTSSEEQTSSLVLNYKFLENRFTVTFDANGGNVDTLTKEVAWGSNYGDLSIPTRDGYTFKGWNGKNLLNYNKLTTYTKERGFIVDETGYVSYSNTSDSRGWRYSESNWYANLDSGKYTLTLYFKKMCTNYYGGIRIFKKSDVSDYYYNLIAEVSEGNLNNNEKVSLSFTLDDNTDIGIIIKGYDGIYKVQIESGENYTVWEPYYVTSLINVTQMKNHTLTAIWEENE